MRPLLGILCIYIFYCIAAILQQKILTTPYLSTSNYQYNYFKYPIGFVLFPSLFAWMIGFILNLNSTTPSNQIPPNSQTFRCGLLIFISSLSFSSSLYYGSYPISVMYRAYNIVPLVVVGLIMRKISNNNTDTHSHSNHTHINTHTHTAISQLITPSKIIFSLITTISIIIFMLAKSQRSLQKQNTYINLILILISLLADGFINIYQNQLKFNTKPQPQGFTLYQHTNKWKLILCLSYLLITFQATDFCKFMYYNQKCLWYFIFYGILSALGEIIVYWLFCMLRNNVIPFIVSTRKITTVLLSVIFYTHYLSMVQIGAVLLMYVGMVWNFFKEVNVQNMEEKQAVRAVMNNIIEGQSFVREHQEF